VEIFEGDQKSDEKSDSILEMENRFRSVGMGASEIGYIDLYPNRWVFSIKIQCSGNWWYIEIISVQKKVMISYHQNQIWCKSKVGISCQYPKYQRVTDILNPLGLGVKISFTILNIFGLARAIGL
jgi:hypothetical protein